MPKLNKLYEESLDEMELYENKSVDQMVLEALDEEKEEIKEDINFNEILKKYAIN